MYAPMQHNKSRYTGTFDDKFRVSINYGVASLDVFLYVTLYSRIVACSSQSLRSLSVNKVCSSTFGSVVLRRVMEGRTHTTKIFA